MNNKNKVRLNDFLRCLYATDRVIINLIRDNKIYMTLFEDKVNLSSNDPIFNEFYNNLIVIRIRYSTCESRYWISVQEDSNE